MREAFPDATGFSDTNVKYMKRWYSFYNEQLIKSQRPVDIFTNARNIWVYSLGTSYRHR